MVMKIAESLISWGVTDNVMTLAKEIMAKVEEAVPEYDRGNETGADLWVVPIGWNLCIDQFRANMGLKVKK